MCETRPLRHVSLQIVARGEIMASLVILQSDYPLSYIIHSLSVDINRRSNYLKLDAGEHGRNSISRPQAKGYRNNRGNLS